MSLPQVDSLHAAVGNLAKLLDTVDTEYIPAGESAGRVLAEPLKADRDSPALSVSAMDGYALRFQDISQSPLPVRATTTAGAAPTHVEPGTAVRIFTGGAVPRGADLVIKREDTIESPEQVTICVSSDALQAGLNVRRQGENVLRGSEVLPAGTVVDAAAMAAVASFAGTEIGVRKRVRVSLLNTGDELAQPGQAVEDWQIRDSNGPMLEAWLSSLPWLECVRRLQVADRLEEVQETLTAAVQDSHAVILTGGVSMGDTDYVPEAIERLGGSTVFHRLPIRPGRPVLGAQVDGKLILGLPGNPVSVAVTSRVIGLPLLKQLAGLNPIMQPLAKVSVTDADDATLPLVWYRLVQVDANGAVRYAQTRGSGDLVSLAQSSGFVQVPAGASGPGPWPLYRWT